ncbi:HNH endonuclease signature motif containing protein [Corynebacterium glucuronolyticum]|uniref:HNH endonuclease signature motif containing protein n=1 Tax=Corynebacterium glucuronolyticum TaxID=39791 RepID=UPI00223C0BC1|nr:HNH endonuclease signature motif containing protein [Corynebacterium glucuronolyticum]MCT1442037.1 HNH endonuclease [Corynebacterium glucuronolyticum]
MNELCAIAELLAQAMTVAGQAFGMSQKALVRLGYDKTTAHTIKKLSNIYYGRASAPQSQERSREKAKVAGCSFASLNAIERFVAKLPKKFAWKIREALVPYGRDITAINAEGARLLQTYRQADNPDKKLTYRSIPNSTFATLTLTAESSRVKQIYDRAQETDTKCPADGLITLALAANDGTLPPAATACVIIGTDLPFTETDDGDYVFSLTNGATMTSKELFEAELSKKVIGALVNPLGPENFGLFDIEFPRFADGKERFFQALRNPVCAWPGCGQPATKSQIHHIKAFKHGGKTTTENLMVLCPFHNGRNDDDLDKPKHGHMVRIDGLEYWQPAFGGPLQLNMHPCAQGGAIRIARRQLGIPIDPSPPGMAYAHG